jgi:hypothetical protein
MRKPLWEIKQAAEGVLQLYIYGDVEGEEFDWENWRYVQSDNSAEHFREELAKHPDVSRIEIYINSYGGSVFEGTAIYNQLKRHPARKVVHVDGFACSIASWETKPSAKSAWVRLKLLSAFFKATEAASTCSFNAVNASESILHSACPAWTVSPAWK